MKKILLVAVAAVGIMVMTGSAFAAPPLDVPVNVTAAVTQKCVVNSPGALDITIDPASAAATQAFTATQPDAQCTKTKGAATAAITATSANAGSDSTGTLIGSLVSGAGNPIPYTFTFSPAVVGNGFGAGAPVAFGIGGSVALADASVAEYGSYTDTVTLTLTY
jgi:hypothetical protein